MVVSNPKDIHKQLELFAEQTISSVPAEVEPTPEPPSGNSHYWEMRGQSLLFEAGTRRIRSYLWFGYATLALFVSAAVTITLHVLK